MKVYGKMYEYYTNKNKYYKTNLRIKREFFSESFHPVGKRELMWVESVLLSQYFQARLEWNISRIIDSLYFLLMHKNPH